MHHLMQQPATKQPILPASRPMPSRPSPSSSPKPRRRRARRARHRRPAARFPTRTHVLPAARPVPSHALPAASSRPPLPRRARWLRSHASRSPYASPALTAASSLVTRMRSWRTPNMRQKGSAARACTCSPHPSVRASRRAARTQPLLGAPACLSDGDHPNTACAVASCSAGSPTKRHV